MSRIVMCLDCDDDDDCDDEITCPSQRQADGGNAALGDFGLRSVISGELIEPRDTLLPLHR